MMNKLYLSLLCSGFLVAGVGCGGSEKEADEPIQSVEDDDEDRPTHRRSKVPDIDDDDDPDLQITGLRGRIEQYDIQQGLKAHAVAIGTCYRSKVRKRGYIGGEVQFKFVVGADGTVETVQIEQSTLGSWAVERCLLDVCRNMVFAKPRGGPTAEFQVPLEFTAKRGVRWWEEDRADKEVAPKLAELHACSPKPEDVWVTMYIGTRGKVVSAGFASKSKTPIADEWATCASAAMSGWILSDPRGQIAKTGFRYAPE